MAVEQEAQQGVFPRFSHERWARPAGAVIQGGARARGRTVHQEPGLEVRRGNYEQRKTTTEAAGAMRIHFSFEPPPHPRTPTCDAVVWAHHDQERTWLHKATQLARERTRCPQDVKPSLVVCGWAHRSWMRVLWVQGAIPPIPRRSLQKMASLRISIVLCVGLETHGNEMFQHQINPSVVSMVSMRLSFDAGHTWSATS